MNVKKIVQMIKKDDEMLVEEERNRQHRQIREINFHTKLLLEILCACTYYTHARGTGNDKVFSFNDSLDFLCELKKFSLLLLRRLLTIVALFVCYSVM